VNVSRFICILSFSIIFASSVYSQSELKVISSLDWFFSVTDTTCLVDLNYLFPSFFRDEAELKRFIRDPRYFSLRRATDDTMAVDAIFLRAFDIADGDTRYAILLALFATMDHARFGIRIPLLGSLYIPLSFETLEIYKQRHTNLPRHLLPDSVGLRVSDKDKLQHFFGSALLMYETDSESLVEWFGNMLEKGEGLFVIGGLNDNRDKLANKLGREFGRRLLDGEDVLPSDVLWKKNIPNDAPVEYRNSMR
jgi:hypothetical protein